MGSTGLASFQAVFSMDLVKVDFSEFTRDDTFSKPEIIAGLEAEGIDAIYLKPLTSSQRAGLESSIAGMNGKKDANNFYARFVSPAWCLADGTKLGTPQEIGQLRSDLLTALFFKVQELNGGSNKAVEEAKND